MTKKKGNTEAENALRLIKPYQQWIDEALPHQLAVAEKMCGSTRAFHDKLVNEILENSRLP